MKQLFLISILFVIISCRAGNQAEKINDSIATQDSLILMNIRQNDWPKAYKEQDTLLIKRILADNFEVIFDSGSWSNKQGEIKWISENKTTTDSLHRDIKRFDFLGNETAVITGTGHVYNNGNHSSYEFTDVFIKQNGVWRATASHVSGSREVD